MHTTHSAQQSAVTPKTKEPRTFFAKDAQALLRAHDVMYKRLKTIVSMSDAMYAVYYQPLYERLAAYCQDFPASANHHHNHKGGLLEHTLEVIIMASGRRQGMVYVEQGEQEMFRKTELLSYAIIVGAALHDIGKLVTDIQTIIIKDNNSKTLWNPLSGPISVGESYMFKYNEDRKSAHHIAANIALLTMIVPDEGIKWLQSDPLIFNQTLAAIGGNTSLNITGQIGECVGFGDKESVKRYQQKHAKLVGLPQQLFHGIKDSLQTAIENNQINRPGATFYFTTSHLYALDRGLIQKLLDACKARGYNPPNNQSVIRRTLLDNNIVFPGESEGGTVNITINLEDWPEKREKSWSQAFSCFCLDRKQFVNIEHIPAISGSISSEDGQLIYPELECNIDLETEAKEEFVDTQQAPLPASENPAAFNKVSTQTPPEATTQDASDNVTTRDEDLFRQYLEKSENKAKRKNKGNRALSQQKSGPQKTNDKGSSAKLGELVYREFVSFISTKLAKEEYVLNAPKQPVLINAEGQLMLVSPAIFHHFIAAKSVELKELFANNYGSDKLQIKTVQMLIYKQKRHTKSLTGEDILNVTFGDKDNTFKLHVMILDPPSSQEIVNNIIPSIPCPRYRVNSIVA